MPIFRADCAPYFDGPIMKHSARDETIDGNGILYTGAYFSILKLYGEISQDADRKQLAQLYDKARVQAGLINRGRDNLSLQKFDDYIGLCRAAQMLDPFIALEIYAYGKSHKWYYQNLPGKIPFGLRLDCMFWRMPGIVQHIKICAAAKLSAFDKFWWGLDVGTSILSSKTKYSGFQKTWIMVQAYKDYQYKTRFMDMCVKLFESSIRRKFPHLMGDVFEGFFENRQDYPPVHPFARWMQGRL